MAVVPTDADIESGLPPSKANLLDQHTRDLLSGKGSFRLRKTRTSAHHFSLGREMTLPLLCSSLSHAGNRSALRHLFDVLDTDDTGYLNVRVYGSRRVASDLFPGLSVRLSSLGLRGRAGAG